MDGRGVKKNSTRENQPQELKDLIEWNLREVFQKKYDLSSDVGHLKCLNLKKESGLKSFVIKEIEEYKEASNNKYQFFKRREIMWKKEYLEELKQKEAEEAERVYQQAMLEQEIRDQRNEEYLREVEEAENARIEDV